MKRYVTFVVVCAIFISLVMVSGLAAEEEQGLAGLEHSLQLLLSRTNEVMPDPASLVRKLKDADAIYKYVAEQIAYQDYAGRLRGPWGTLQAGAGNAWDQCELLVTMLNYGGSKCRYVRGKRQESDGGWVDHVWVQMRGDDGWRDLDPTFPELSMDGGLLRPGDVITAIPGSLVHKVRLEIKFRLNDAGRRVDRSALVQEFDIADLCGKPLTLATRFDGYTSQNGYVLEVLQPLLELGGEQFPGEMVPEAEGQKRPPAASRLGGVFDQPKSGSTASPAAQEGLDVLSEWVEVQMTSPGAPKDRFIYTIFERSQETAENLAPLDGLINAVAFGFSPVPVGEEALNLHVLADAPDVQLMVESLRQISAEDFSPTAPPNHLTPEDRARINLALEAGNRVLAQAVLLNYLRRADEALHNLSAPVEASAFRGMPRAIIASVSYQGGKLRYDFDLRKNPATFVLPAGAPAEWYRFLNYHRGLYESRLEGAVLMSFTGEPGITAGSVLTAAQEQGIPLRALVRENRHELPSLEVGKMARSEIIKALNDGKTVLLPERPVTLAGIDVMAWYEYDPKTGYIEGVFPSGKHQAMTEYIMEDIVMKGLVSQAMSYLVSTVAGYYFSIASGLGHFYACLLDLETPSTPCFGTGEVCEPAKADAVMLCTGWRSAQQNFELGMGWISADITGMLPWPNAWEQLAGEPCARGASYGLKMFGCGN